MKKAIDNDIFRILWNKRVSRAQLALHFNVTTGTVTKKANDLRRSGFTMLTHKERQSSEEVVLEEIKQSVVSIAKYCVANDGREFKIVEAHKMFNEVDDSWGCRDLMKTGHRLVSYRLSNRSAQRKAGTHSEFIIGDSRTIKVIRSEHYSISMPEVMVSRVSDFDGVFGRIKRKIPLLATHRASGNNWPLYMSRMRTSRVYKGEEYIFSWHRIKLEDEDGNTIYKLILTHIGGMLVSACSQKIKDNILKITGEKIVYQGICKLNSKSFKSAYCSG